jgi:hypothetical protein
MRNILRDITNWYKEDKVLVLLVVSMNIIIASITVMIYT